jgi:hypothetical protein
MMGHLFYLTLHNMISLQINPFWRGFKLTCHPLPVEPT